MGEAEFDLSESISILERSPASLSALLSGLTQTWIYATEGAGTWSPADVVIHLVHVERTNWIPRIRHILAGNQQPFAPLDRAGGATEWKNRPLTAALAAFTESRHESLNALRALGLTSADLVRKGRHPDLGDVTLAQLLATWVVHDLDHLAQITRTMAKVYTDATGPWSSYLSILKDRLKTN